MRGVSIKQLEAIVLLDTDGKRIAVKYYNDKVKWKEEDKESGGNASGNVSSNIGRGCDETYNGLRGIKDQKLFEADITEKSKKLCCGSSEVEVLLLNKYIVLCLSINDVNMYIVGDENDNEIILYELMQTIQDSLNNITNNQIGKKQLIDKLDLVYLLLDEIADCGIIMETNSNVIISRLYMQEGELHEHTPLNQAISSAKDNIIRSLLSGT
ncbi:coatomer zeta-1 subunit [Plasmodium ovale curtisi]|nr:coatomer zeta-1 subunit [Plasmodium ovale curtisi]